MRSNSISPLGNPVIFGDAVKGEGQDELACPRRPAERGLGLTHPLTRTNDPPQDVG